MSGLVPSSSGGGALGPAGGGEGGSLADVLERVLDKGVVIAGDIRVNLLDIELLTIKLRLLVAGVDTARRIGIDWWERDPWLSGAGDAERRDALGQRLDRLERRLDGGDGPPRELERENAQLREELDRLRGERAREGAAERGGGDG